MKLVWRFGAKPTGRYRSFEIRAWPMAYWDSPNGEPAVKMSDVAGEGYSPRIKDNSLIVVYIADHSVKPWKWKKINTKAYGFKEAKSLADRALRQYPSMWPKAETDS